MVGHGGGGIVRESGRREKKYAKEVEERENGERERGGEIDGTMVTPGTGWQSVCEVIEVRGKF